jgi:hypothetical protein
MAHPRQTEEDMNFDGLTVNQICQIAELGEWREVRDEGLRRHEAAVKKIRRARRMLEAAEREAADAERMIRAAEQAWLAEAQRMSEEAA